MSAHAFVRKDDDAKQVPLAYILMSRRSKEDYVEVLSSLKRRLGQPQVEWFMLDFEAAALQAIREVFPGCVLKGCSFHWNQQLYWKIQAEGLARSYTDRGDKYDFLRKVMALPYLQIPLAFRQLLDQAVEVGGPILRVDGIRREDMDKRQDVATYPLERVQGNRWHRRINTRAGRSDLGFYMLIPLLKAEAKTVDLQIRLVSQHLMTRLHRAQYVRVHGDLFDAWDLYEDEELTTTQLLRRCSHIVGLGPSNIVDPVYQEEGF